MKIDETTKIETCDSSTDQSALGSLRRQAMHSARDVAEGQPLDVALGPGSGRSVHSQLCNCHVQQLFAAFLVMWYSWS